MRRLFLIIYCACSCVLLSQGQTDDIPNSPLIYIYEDTSNSMLDQVYGKTKMYIAEMAAVDSIVSIRPAKPDSNFSAYVLKNGEPIDAAVKVFRSGEKKFINELHTEADTVFMSLSPGIYDFEFQVLGESQVQPITISNIVIFADSLVHQNICFEAGTIIVTTLNNEVERGANMSIYDNVTKKRVATGRIYGKKSIAEINPGVYDIEVHANDIFGTDAKHWIEKVKVVKNEIAKLEHDFKCGKLNAISTNNGEKCDVLVYITSKITGKRTGIGRTYGEYHISDITPGLYEVTFDALNINGKQKLYIKEGVEIKTNELTEVKHNFETGIIAVGAKSGGKLIDVDVQIYEMTTKANCGGGRTFLSPFSNPLKTVLIPGTYEVRVYGVGAYKDKVEKITVEVSPGETIEKTIEF